MAVKRTVVTVLTSVAALWAASSGGAASAAPSDSFSEALLFSAIHPEASLPEVNDFSCVPSSSHPEPVVLVHGFLENSFANWASLAPRLVAGGYCVFALNYGARESIPVGGFDSIEDSAEELSAFVDEVLVATGAQKVAIVGHSKGGTVPRYYVRFLGGADRTSKIIALSPPNRESTPRNDDISGGSGQVEIPAFGPPVDDALARINVPSDTVPGVEYTVVVTRYDQVVPYTASLLQGEGARNVILQDLCPADTVDHTGISYDPVAQQVVLDALAGVDPRSVTC
ncbi:triacylglycerol lipase [Rhodococcus sp. 14-2470-1a]|uniref:esterase/lipase family protein n=1 Tax=Rhodococcus sp. 14-2470-1a TaxID=2023150 RepID=UPI000B9B6C6A|nr:alpha/beta fold hydrolase [Rhodococcus sp. 14-2470-1a]OZF47290.1 lipase [Rhodococcus sp. 14-2470-1a]